MRPAILNSRSTRQVKRKRYKGQRSKETRLYLRRRSLLNRLRQPNAQQLNCDLGLADPQTGVAPGVTQSRNVRSRYRCSMCPAIHINSRSWLRSSSTHEPSDPPPRVVFHNLVSRPRLKGFACLGNVRATATPDQLDISYQ